MERSAINQRLRAFIKAKNLTVRGFEKRIGVGNGYVRGVKDVIGDRIMADILRQFPELNTEWLFKGEGEMLREPSINHNALFMAIGKTRANGNVAQVIGDNAGGNMVVAGDGNINQGMGATDTGKVLEALLKEQEMNMDLHSLMRYQLDVFKGILDKINAK